MEPTSKCKCGEDLVCFVFVFVDFAATESSKKKQLTFNNIEKEPKVNKRKTPISLEIEA